MKRRAFIKNTSLLVGSWSLGIHLSGCENPTVPNADTESFMPSAFLNFTQQGDIIFQLHRAEMGQGVYTGMTTLVAEELEIDPRQILVEHAFVHPEFNNADRGMMLTVGSTSVQDWYTPLRVVGATARTMLLQAAAHHWQLPVRELTPRDGAISHAVTGRSVSYAELVPIARQLPVPESDTVILKPPRAFRYIGTFDQRLDATDKITGRETYTIDKTLPGMLNAVVVHPPHYGGTLLSLDSDIASQQAGVESIFKIDTGVAVVADNYWHALQASKRLTLDWQAPEASAADSQEISRHWQELLNGAETSKLVEEGLVPENPAGQLFTAEYFVPYLAHAPMEPLSCVADVQNDSAELWCGTQGPDVVVDLVARRLGLKRSQVTIHNLTMGGSFGRRSFMDFSVEAALISHHMHAPVKLTWPREDDIQHDFYRPAVLSRVSARLSKGHLQQWSHRLVAPSVFADMFQQVGSSAISEWMPAQIPKLMSGFMATKGIAELTGLKQFPYQCDYFKAEYCYDNPGIPVGYWRSVGSSHNCFVVESFIDELVSQQEEDGLAFRLSLLTDHPRRQQVLRVAAKQSGWPNAPSGRFLGIASDTAQFGTDVAEVVEASIEKGRIKVHRVTCVVDCGQVVNPDIVLAQVEGSIIFGLTAALYGEMQFKDGAALNSNFDDYPLLRMDESPQIDIHIIDSDAEPSGIGEPALPPLAPALANALFAASGKRFRQLPLRL